MCYIFIFAVTTSNHTPVAQGSPPMGNGKAELEEVIIREIDAEPRRY